MEKMCLKYFNLFIATLKAFIDKKLNFVTSFDKTGKILNKMYV